MSDVGIHIDADIRGLSKALKATEDGLQKDLAKAHKTIADNVLREVKPKIPVRSGKMVKTIKASGTQREAKIRAYRGIRYGGWVEYGGRLHNRQVIDRPKVKDGRYVRPTIRNMQPEIIDEYEKLLREVIAKAGLD